MSISCRVRVLAVPLALAAALLLGPAPASAKLPSTAGVGLRVVDPAQGTPLGDFTQYTTTTTIPTSKQAKCFGKGTGGSGSSFKLAGPTALGALREAGPVDHALRPLSISDYYLDSYGPAVCGIGSSVASGSSYWDLIVNHKTSSVGGGQRVHGGDSVLWYLSPSYPPGPELRLKLPAVVPASGDYQATVYQYDGDTGTRSPAAGVSVDFASAPTDANGHTTVSLGGPDGSEAGVGATRSADSAIPDEQAVCISSTPSSCPPADSIYGSRHADQISSPGSSDYISAGRGADRVKILSGGIDDVTCGHGVDTVIRQRADHDDHIHANCERVIRR